MSSANLFGKRGLNVSEYNAEYYRKNAEKLKARARARYATNRTRIREQQNIARSAKGSEWMRDQNLRAKFGFGIEVYNDLLNRQGGYCAICRAPAEGQNFSVDHDHETGQIRGLLCRGCNTGIGCLKEDIVILTNAIEFLRLNKRGS